MNQPETDYRFLKVKNGKPYFAVIKVRVDESTVNNILEDYSGAGFRSQGVIEEVPAKGYNDWKIAAVRGIEFVLNRAAKKWIVKLEGISGRMGIDTNATIVGYAAILAICDKISFDLDSKTKQELEDFVWKSWQDNNYDKIPNFENLDYS